MNRRMHVKEYGQTYVESVNEAVEALSQTWRAYGDQLEQSMTTERITFKVQGRSLPEGLSQAVGSAAERNAEDL